MVRITMAVGVNVGGIGTRRRSANEITCEDGPCPAQGLSDLYGEMSGKGASASEAHRCVEFEGLNLPFTPAMHPHAFAQERRPVILCCSRRRPPARLEQLQLLNLPCAACIWTETERHAYSTLVPEDVANAGRDMS
jgi:hypothetical protein